MRRLLPILAFAATFPTTVGAQQSTDGPYVLHEYVDAVDMQGINGTGGANPEVAREEFFGAGQPPALSLETRPGEPIYDKDGPVFDRPIDTPYGALSPYAAANTLDDRTDRVDSLTYFANFDPSVIPYKRVVAKNHAVRRGQAQYALDVQSGERRPVDLDSPPNGPSDTFWGTFLVRLEPGRVHPIASISPDQRILQIVSEPDVALDFERDAADNFFIRASQPGLVRVNVQVAVPTFYFGGAFPDVAWTDFPSDVTPPLDPALRAHALAIAQKLGFTKTQSPATTVVSMVSYFRDFDARPFPEELKGGDLLETIATSAIGVCRHRSLAFVFLAQAMGIPTRYVYNEAHAFVEVFWPGHGWRRLDLGGAANELNASANDGRPVHDPGDDGLPTPKRYLEEQERMAHNGWEPPNARGDGGGESNGTGRSNANNSAAEPGTSSTNGAANANPTPGPPGNAPDAPVFEEPPPDTRELAALRIASGTAVVRRGEALQIEATLTDASGKALPGRQIEIFLGAVGSTNARSARSLGHGTTGTGGRLRMRVEIPAEQAIGRWSLFLRFPGDANHQPAVAE